MNKFAVVVVVAALLCTEHASASDRTREAWLALHNLVGTWKLADPSTAREKDLRISYRLISAGTALVETFGRSKGQVTETIYHLDGERLIATHYCAQGNQPRLSLQDGGSKNTLEFKFFDATNLADENQSHLIRMQFEFAGPKRLTKQEVYSANGKEEATTLSLVRIP